jgi:hypothetical protein
MSNIQALASHFENQRKAATVTVTMKALYRDDTASDMELVVDQALFDSILAQRDMAFARLEELNSPRP